jgi:hypothetical protein
MPDAKSDEAYTAISVTHSDTRYRKSLLFLRNTTTSAPAVKRLQSSQEPNSTRGIIGPFSRGRKSSFGGERVALVRDVSRENVSAG